MTPRAIVLSLFLSFVLAAQTTPPALPTAVFPARQAQLTDLQAAANLSYSTLTAQVNPGDMTLNVVSGIVFPVPTSVVIDSEIIRVCAKSTSSLTVCTGGRASEGTVANTHLVGSFVQQRLTAIFHNQTAAEVMALEKRAYQDIFVTDFGAKCDSVTDDTLAIQNTIAYAQGLTTTNGLQGGIVRFPNANTLPQNLVAGGACMVSGSIQVPAGVTLRGNGTGAGPFLVALPGGTWQTYTVGGGTYTYMIQNGLSTSYPQFGAKTEGLGINGKGYVNTIVFSANMEEGSDIFDVSANGFTSFGFDLVGSGTQNSWLDHFSTNPASGVTNSIGVRWEGAGLVRQRISNGTIQGGGAGTQQHSPGILVSYSGSVDHVHCEFYDDCVQVVSGSVSLSNIDCNSTATVGVAVSLMPGAASTVIEASNNGIIICDHTIVGSGTCDGVSGVTSISEGDQVEAFHSTNAVVNGNYLSLATGVGAALHHLILGTTLTLPGPINLPHEIIGDWGGGMYINILQGNPQGLMMQSNQTPRAGSREGGGLDIGGGGYQGDPSVGWMMAGSVFDGGTNTATAGNASGITLGGGAGAIFANQGSLLNVDYTFTARQVAYWDQYGFQFDPLTTAGPCTTSNIGRLWINASVTPYRVEFCTNTGWNYATLTAGP